MKTHAEEKNDKEPNHAEKEISPVSRKFLLALACFVYVFVLISLTLSSGGNIAVIFISILPFLAHISFLFFFIEDEKKLFRMIWLMPVILSVLFYIVWYSGLSVLNQIDGSAIFVLNIILCYLLNAAFIIFYKRRYSVPYRRHMALQDNFHSLRKSYMERSSVQSEEIENLRRQLKEFEDKLKVTKENFSFNLRSIEDKCKSINFVIGRVYSKKNGGNDSMRDVLKINSEWYNAFSEITQDFKKEDSARLYIIIDSINQKLNVLEMRENEVFDNASLSKLELSRGSEGNDKVIDVLAANDKDPVYDYQQEAKEICKRIMEYLKNIQ